MYCLPVNSCFFQETIDPPPPHTQWVLWLTPIDQEHTVVRKIRNCALCRCVSSHYDILLSQSLILKIMEKICKSPQKNFCSNFIFLVLWKWPKNKLFHIKHLFLRNLKNFLPKTYFSLIVVHILMSFLRVFFSKLPLLK